MKNILLALFIIAAIGCAKQKEELIIISAQESVEAPAQEIKAENILKKTKVIKLETSNNSLISAINGVIELDDSYVINNGEKQCLRFSKDGKFLNTISSYGRGANEHSYLLNIWEKDGNVYLMDIKYEILIYTPDGEHISNLQMDSYLKSNVSNVYVLQNGDIVTFSPDKGPAPKRSMLVFANLSTRRDALQLKDSIPHINPLQEAANINWYFKEGQFVEKGKELFYKTTLNDTIYSLQERSGKYHLTPAYVFDLGKYAAIEDARLQTSKSFFASKPLDPFKQMQKIGLLGITDKFIIYTDDNKNAYFYNITNGKMDKYKLDAIPITVDSNGNLICYRFGENDQANPELIIGRLN
ncbi:MAG: 6-bladed beta-propeller [Bacteroidales bacterium]